MCKSKRKNETETEKKLRIEKRKTQERICTLQKTQLILAAGAIIADENCERTYTVKKVNINR